MKAIAIISLVLFSFGCSHFTQGRFAWNKSDLAAAGFMASGKIADGVTTVRVLHEGGTECNPLMGKRPSSGKVVAFMAASTAVVLLIAHVAGGLSEKWGHKARKFILMASGITNWSLAVHNYRVADNLEDEKEKYEKAGWILIPRTDGGYWAYSAAQ